MADVSFSLDNVLTIVAIVVPIVASVAGASYKLSNSIADIKKGNAAFRVVLLAYIKSLGSLIGHMSRKGALTNDEVADIQRNTTSETTEKLLSILAGSNPISPEEAARLRDYYQRNESGMRLTEQEAQEFYNLSSRLSQEHSADVGALLLLGAAAFALGYFMGSSDKGTKKRR